MLERDGGIIRAVAWSEICPWLSIFQTFRLAISFRVLFMAAAAILLTVIGWSFLGKVFWIVDKPTQSTEWLKPIAESPLQTITDIVPNDPSVPDTWWRMDVSSVRYNTTEPSDPVFFPFMFLNLPLLEGILNLNVDLRSVVCLIFCGAWSLAVWAFFGAAICRIASVQMAAGERITWTSALQHASSKFLSYFFAPLIPIFVIALASLPVLVFGFIMKIGGVGIFFSALFWPLLLVAGLVITLVLLGLFFGWPLMWGAISTEGTDSFDALSRSYAYVYQRPLHYLFYSLVAAIFGWLGWLFVRNFASGIIGMTYWAASWGAGEAQIRNVMPGGSIDGIGSAGAWLIHFWTGCIKVLAVGYLFSFFWVASVAIYYLLRRSVDATEMDEVFLDADEGEKSFPLPKVTTDECGAPAVAEGTATTEGEIKT
jgi:hypothetical protein